MKLVYLAYTLGINDFIKQQVELTVKNETEKVYFIEEADLIKSKFLKSELGVIKTPVETFTGMSLNVLCLPEQVAQFDNTMVNDFSQWLNQYHNNYINLLLVANKKGISCPAAVDMSQVNDE